MLEISRRSIIAGTLSGFAVSMPLRAAPANAYDFSFTSIEGVPLPLSDYRGKVVMVVNTASFCGFTGQYAGLQGLWERYRERGLIVLGVPSNDFGSQEPGTEAEIKTFCETEFAVDFPLTEKQQVKGEGAHAFYRWASDTLGSRNAPRWNFHKYLIGRDGSLAGSFGTLTGPESGKLVTAIESLLNTPAG